ncbi:RIP metalloprotease RseP [Hyphobacterium sp. CCMP332]|nr:RIP metalloprotease RseP [Hyphobacterium sp. CCMP332]
MEGLIMTGQLLLGLSILVGLHELGHLIAAKVFGMRVEKYSIGFPPKIWGIKYGETEYSIGAIPLGGFVKIAGMVDESLDTDKMESHPEPWEFRAKPAWQRLIVMLGGIIVNVITGIVIFAMLKFSYGETFISKDEVNKHGIYAHSLAEEIGLKTGDKIVKINGEDFDDFAEVQGSKVLLESNAFFTVLRDGSEVIVEVPDDFISKKIESDEPFISPLEPFIVGEVLKGSVADKGGLQTGDKIISVNGIEVNYFQTLVDVLSENKGNTVNAKISRNGENLEKEFEVGEDGKLGFYSESLLQKSTVEYGFFESIPKGAGMAFTVVYDNIKGFGKIFSGDVAADKAISGPIGIAKFFGGQWIWQKFWYITGLLSMVLAFMNLLPIPALDGGHVVFLLFEIVSGRAPSLKFLEVAQKIGMVILLGIMGFAIFNDIIKVIF